MAETLLTFKRYEKKYLLSPEKYAALRAKLEGFIEPDRFFSSTVCSIYYDSSDYNLIRQSIEKPVYKEKLRLRSYNVPKADSEVFVELKKKYKGIVYKRRVPMACSAAHKYLLGEAPAPERSQIINEIDWFLKTNAVEPKVFIACEREAYVAKENRELRVTFDMNLRWRETELDLTKGSRGEPLTQEGWVLMELKIPGAMPLWLAHILSGLEIFPTSFSKYGTAYTANILNNIFSSE